MANYYGVSRSNYFKVKDIPAFKEFLESAGWGEGGLRFFENNPSHPGKVGFGNEDSFPYLETADGDPDTGLFLDELAKHLEEGEVCVMEESGHEKLRYICGISIAINHKGETLALYLSDMKEKIKNEWGITDVTDCHY